MEPKNKNPRFEVEGFQNLQLQDDCNSSLEESQPTPKHVSYYLDNVLQTLIRNNPQEGK